MEFIKIESWLEKEHLKLRFRPHYHIFGYQTPQVQKNNKIVAKANGALHQKFVAKSVIATKIEYAIYPPYGFGYMTNRSMCHTSKIH